MGGNWVAHGELALELSSGGGLLLGGVSLPALLELLAVTWEDNKVGLVLTEALNVGSLALDGPVAAARVHGDSEGLGLELAETSIL